MSNEFMNIESIVNYTNRVKNIQIVNKWEKKKTITVFIEKFWFSKLQKSTNRDFQHKFTDSSSCNIADIIYFCTFCVPSLFFFFSLYFCYYYCCFIALV